MDAEEMNDALEGQRKRVDYAVEKFDEERKALISFIEGLYAYTSDATLRHGRLFGSLAMLLLREEGHSFTFSKEERAKVAQLLNANSISFKEEMGEDDSKILTLVFGGE